MRGKTHKAAKIIAIGSMALLSSNVFADKTSEKLLKILVANGAINQTQYEELSMLVKEDETAAAKAIENEVKVSLKGGHFKMKTADGQFKMQIGGRIMADTAWYDDPDNKFGDGTELRRARIFVKGTVWDNWHYKFQYDFAGGGAIKDAYIKYTGLKQHLDFPLDVTAGNFKEPFSLEELTSSKYITFMERALPNTFAPGRNLGVQLSSHGKVMDGGWTAAVGWFGKGFDDDEVGSGFDESTAVAGRVTFAPIATKTKVLHFGGAAEYRSYDANAGAILRVRERPESHIADHRLVDTGRFSAGNTTKWGFETAGVYGPFSIQSEYMHMNATDVNRTAQDARLNGWYVYGSYFITGESRNYSAKKGAFGRVKPNSIVGQGGWGAWELAARYSSLELESIPGANGWEEYNVTLGLNWYATPSIRFMANYVLTDSNNPNFDDPNIFQLRGQIDF